MIYHTPPVKSPAADLLARASGRTLLTICRYRGIASTPRPSLVQRLAQSFTRPQLVETIQHHLHAADQQLLCQLCVEPTWTIDAPSHWPWQLGYPWPQLAHLSATARLMALGCIIPYRAAGTLVWGLAHEVCAAMQVVAAPLGAGWVNLPLAPPAASLVDDAVMLLASLANADWQPDESLHVPPAIARHLVGGASEIAIGERRQRLDGLLRQLAQLHLVGCFGRRWRVTALAGAWLRQPPHTQWTTLSAAWLHDPWWGVAERPAWDGWRMDWRAVWQGVRAVLHAAGRSTLDLAACSERWAPLLPLDGLAVADRAACVAALLHTPAVQLGLAQSDGTAARLTSDGVAWTRRAVPDLPIVPPPDLTPLALHPAMPAALRWALYPWCERTRAGWRISAASMAAAQAHGHALPLLQQVLTQWYGRVPDELPTADIASDPPPQAAASRASESVTVPLPTEATVLALQIAQHALPWLAPFFAAAHRAAYTQLAPAQRESVDTAWTTFAPLWRTPADQDQVQHITLPPAVDVAPSQSYAERIATLHGAIDHQTSVDLLYYVPTTRQISRRVVRPLSLEPPYLRALQANASDERTFRLDRILKVAAAQDDRTDQG